MVCVGAGSPASKHNRTETSKPRWPLLLLSKGLLPSLKSRFFVAGSVLQPLLGSALRKPSWPSQPSQVGQAPGWIPARHWRGTRADIPLGRRWAGLSSALGSQVLLGSVGGTSMTSTQLQIWDGARNKCGRGRGSEGAATVSSLWHLPAPCPVTGYSQTPCVQEQLCSEGTLGETPR